jgi:D-aminopeptidase
VRSPWPLAADVRIGVEAVVIPMVGECDDSWLNDARVVQVEAADAGRAVEAASHQGAEGAVGAGTGMIAFGWKAGIGTASPVGVLVLANFGSARDLRFDGVPVYPALAHSWHRDELEQAVEVSEVVRVPRVQRQSAGHGSRGN